jgi:2-oxoglutarate ferredoxin oxidoreductase subunit gamma
MKSLIRIVLAGSGGQGLGLAGKILAEAAIHGGKNAAHSQSYGARARGGSSSSAVTIGSGEIVYPLVEQPDILVTLTQESYDINRPLLAAGGIVLYDRDSVTAEGGPDEHGLPITSRAREMKNEKGVSLLALGVLVGITSLVEPAGMETAIEENFTSAAGANRQAFLEGLALGREYAPSPVQSPSTDSQGRITSERL